MDLKKVNESMKDDIDAVTSWCSDIYNSKFSAFFHDASELFSRLKSKDRPITDEELSWILIQLPIQLFSVSEALNSFKISHEVVKLKNKQRERDLVVTSIEKSAAKKLESATEQLVENKLLSTAYSTVIDRVSSEISFCRELIMGAKKIWDSRRAADKSNPITEVDPMLPDYQRRDSGKSYIRGSEGGKV